MLGRWLALVSLAMLAMPQVPGLGPLSGATILVSADDGEFQGDQRALFPDISSDGRYIAFDGAAPGMVGSDLLFDPAPTGQVYLRDTQTFALELVSVTPSGDPGNAQSAYATLSADGRHVAFLSLATDLVATPRHPQMTPSDWSVYLRDRALGTTEAVAVDPAGFVVPVQFDWPRITADGTRLVVNTPYPLASQTPDDGISRIYVVDRAAGTAQVASLGVAGETLDAVNRPDISADGNHVVFWTEGDRRVFLRDALLGVTTQVSLPTERAFSPSISGDGRTIGYLAYDENSVHNADLVVWDRGSGKRERLVESAEPYDAPAMSFNGRFVTSASAGLYGSSAVLGPPHGDLSEALLPGVYVWDRAHDSIEFQSVGPDGVVPVPGSTPRISADGTRVVFSSPHALAPDDRPVHDDVYLRQTPRT